jgi:protein-S-isoprenylcysteine O-methyltransferase Ste14
MESLTSPVGSVGLAIAALVVVLGYRFTLPVGGRDFGGLATFLAAVAVIFLAGCGLISRGALATLETSRPLRMGGGVLIAAGLLLAGQSWKARLSAGRGRLATSGPYARVRHPLYLGLGLVLAGHLFRSPSNAGAIAAALAIAHYAALSVIEEREARRAFGPDWGAYAAQTRAILPLPRRRTGRGANG